MSVVTISNELGSQGSLIAAETAGQLGYHLADQAMLENILKDYGLVEFDEEYRSIPGFWDRFDAAKQERRDTFLKMLNQILEALAHHGDVVILGRGGFAVLAGMADVLNVRIQAPLDLRIERTEGQPSFIAPNPAEQVVKESDKIQKTFVESVYGVPWDDTKAFDLVIDTEKIDPSLAAGMIAQAVKGMKAPGTGGRATARELVVDPVLASAVRDVLECQTEHVS
jgi:cytidylate kinase